LLTKLTNEVDQSPTGMLLPEIQVSAFVRKFT
jgi:hypothetical protein